MEFTERETRSRRSRVIPVDSIMQALALGPGFTAPADTTSGDYAGGARLEKRGKNTGSG
jgi:hypothetical protein